MRITSLGHASLFVETDDQRVFVDPVFSSDILDGALVYSPAREIVRDRIPIPTAVIVTHAHFDHFHPESLALLPRNTPIFTPEEQVSARLSELGFRNFVALEPWREISIGSLRIRPTPSDHGEPECGVCFSDATGSFWHMADGEVTPRVAYRLRAIYDHFDVVAAKYQPVVRASIGYLRGHGAQFDAAEVVSWLETAALCEPRLVFPFASGLAFAGRHTWFNRYAFPLSPADVARVFGERLGDENRARVIFPGDVIELAEGPTVHAQSSNFVRRAAGPESAWEPVDVGTLDGLESADAQRELESALERLLSGPFSAWISREVARRESLWSALRENRVVWQLVVHAGADKRLQYAIDFRKAEISRICGVHPEANSFTHLGGATLRAVLSGEAPALLFWLAGQARSFEKVLTVRDGRFVFPKRDQAPQHRLGDPLTYYLRHSRADSVAEPHPVHDERPNETRPALDDELFAHAYEGGSKMLALLGKLALAEAARRGIEIDTARVKATSDAFRRRFGLSEPADIQAWCDASTLDDAAFVELMAGIAAARALTRD